MRRFALCPIDSRAETHQEGVTLRTLNLGGALLALATLLASHPAWSAEPGSPAEDRLTFDGSLAATRSLAPGVVNADAIAFAIDARLNRFWGVRAEGAVFAPFHDDDPSRLPFPSEQLGGEGGAALTFRVLRTRPWSPVPELYVESGAGIVWTRPVSAVDPAIRSFAWSPSLSLFGGAGLRFLLGRNATVGIEVLDSLYDAHLENAAIAATAAERLDPATWYGAYRLVNDIELRVGFGARLPVP
jgi:hypothetical protein